MAGTWEELHVYILKELEQLNARMKAFDTALVSITLKDAEESTTTRITLAQLRQEVEAVKKTIQGLEDYCRRSAEFRNKCLNVETSVGKLEESIGDIWTESNKQGKDIVRFNLVYKIIIAVITAALVALSAAQIKSCGSPLSLTSLSKQSTSAQKE
jgi:hypothetical protein